MSQADPSPTVVEVLRFEDLPGEALASRRAVVRFSDGSEGEALRWYSDEILVCEGDHKKGHRPVGVISLQDLASSAGKDDVGETVRKVKEEGAPVH